RYANGGWLGTAKIPAGQKSFDTRAILAAKTSGRVRTLIQDAAASHAVKGTVAQKVGDYYASFMDQDGIVSKGLGPFAAEVARIADADTRAAGVLELEIAMARAHAPDSEAADVFKQNNPWKRGDFAVKAPGIDWDAYFKAAGLADQSEFIVWQPIAFTGTST